MKKFLGTVAVIVGFLVAALCVRLELRNIAPNARGVVTTAVSMARLNEREWSGYRGSVLFRTATGEPVNVECIVPERIARRSTSRVQIRYLPDDPTVVDFPGAVDPRLEGARKIGSAIGLAFLAWFAVRLSGRRRN